MKKYQTIVIDPPWPMKFGKDKNYMLRPSYINNWPKSKGSENYNNNFNYPTMSIEEIGKLDIPSISTENCHLYLWVTNKHILDAYKLVEVWGFKPSCLLTWAKTPKGLGLGGTFVQTTEHILFARKGENIALKRETSTWWNWKRPQGGIKHSAKPEEFQDLIESISPSPRVELFARRKRQGWDVWGNEVESDVDLAPSK